MSEHRESESARVEELNSLVVDDLATAVRAAPEADRAAYLQMQDSVLEARRRAETNEGLLRIS